MNKKTLLSLMLLCFAFFGVARADVVEIGVGGTSSNSYLPNYELYNYSLTQQIYTADEIGTAGTINSIAFYYAGTETRTLDIYMVNTTVGSFSGNSDWITVTDADKVYSGSVTYTANAWNTFVLDTPFEYDGTSNLAVIVDDNTGSWVSGIGAYVFDATGMALYIYSDQTNYDPMAPPIGSGTVLNVKNQIQLDITPASATLTVHDNTGTNSYVPFFGIWVDDYTRNEMIYPADELSSLAGKDINSLTFYKNSTNTNSWGAASFQIYLKEVSETSLSAYIGMTNATIVYEGGVDAAGGEIPVTISFTTPYHYNGGNLLVGIYQTVSGNYSSAYWYGESVTGASASGYNSSSAASATFNQRDFLPKTTFSYTEAVSAPCLAPSNLTVTNVTANTATLSWTENGNANRWVITYVQGDPQLGGTHYVEAYENPYTLTNLTPNTMCSAWVSAFCDGDELSGESNFISFTTLEDCPSPQNVAVSSITDTEATVSWSDYNDSYELQLGNLSDSIQILLYESFDNGFSYNWSNDPTYPWTFVDGHLQSGNAGMENSTSSISVFMYFDTFGTVEFDAECMGEGSSTFWDHCDFSIDGEIMLNAGENLNTAGWLHYSYPVTAGQHTFTWSYTKDGSINPTGDYFAIDNVVMGLTEIEWGNSVYVQNPPYTFTGLNPFTDYYVQVRGICGNNAQQTITAWSEPIHFSTLGYYTVTVSANSADGGTVTGGGVFYSGDTCTVIASPNDYYYFSHWSKNGITVSYDSIYSFAVTENANMVANFNPMGYDFWLIADPEDGGQVEFLDGNDYYAYFGDTITISATSNPNYRFLKWTASGRYGRSGRSEVELSTDSIYNFILDADFLNSIFDNGVSGGGGQEQAYIELTAQFIGGIGDCIQPLEFTTTEVGPTLATFSWTELGNSESWQMYYRPAYTVAYVPYDSLEIFQNPYTLTGLQPNTAYEAYIIPSCGITDGIANSYLASNTVTFTTLEACPTPMNVEVTNITGTSATVTWVGYSDSYQVQLGHPDFAIGAHFTNGIPADWVNSTDYPWTVIDGHMQSSNAGVPNSTSSISVTVTFPADGSIEFDAECMGEGEGASGYCYDHCDFYIDTTRVLYAGNEIEGWNHYFYNVTVGEHTFTWSYTKDGLVDNPGDHFAVDNVVMQAGEIIWDNPISVENAQYTIMGMNPTNNYCVRVKGVNADMESGWSNPIFFTTAEAQSYTITVSASPTDGGTVTGTGTYIQGTSCTLTATASVGYTFLNWTKNGQVVSSSPNYTFTVTEDAIYVANFSRNSYTITVTANPADGGTVTGSGTYYFGATVNLTATAATGHTFTGWSDGVMDNPRVITVTGSAIYTANFSTNSYAITATANPTGGGTVTGSGTYNHGATVTLTATANAGYTFLNWTKNGQVVSSNSTYTFTASGAGTYVANFQQIEYYPWFTVIPEDGGSAEIQGDGIVHYGDQVTIIATPNQGYDFVNWTTENFESAQALYLSDQATYTFTMNSNHFLTNMYPNGGEIQIFANFELQSFEITVMAEAGGTITGDSTGTYAYGDTLHLNAVANQGYTFTNWTKNGTVVSTTANSDFVVTETATYVAHFSTNAYQITVSASPTEGGTVTGGGSYSYGEQATLTATANTGYTFLNWTKEDGQQVSTDSIYIFNVTESTHFIANFQLNRYTITVEANPTEGGTVTGSGTYDYGTVVNLTATAATGYTFIGWSDGVTDNPRVITVTGPAEYTANFSTNSYLITVTANPTEGGTVTGGGTYNHGATVNLSATAATGYTFIGWSDGVTDNPRVITVTG
ncbi:MAG: fibronectin type III domain-containing protein, partial [Muribaculaceae bacterium]|nr:fibronectin type III domain-containing protein [Muribaculaceae bacterium]